METLRDVDAYCGTCAEPTIHVVRRRDPGLAVCDPCGGGQLMVVPLAA